MQLMSHRRAAVVFVITLISLKSAIAQQRADLEVQPSNLIEQVQFNPTEPLAPIDRRPAEVTTEHQPHRQTINAAELFGSVRQLESLSPHRRRLAQSPAASAVFGSESKGRVSKDVGDLLQKSISSHGVTTQNRTPIVSDTRVRGQRAGQVLASGSYWTPVRPDLDTMMNKIDSRLIEDVIIIKGPYSTRYGPGFRFVDFDLLQTPRYDGFEAHGSTSFDYDTNGEQFYGRQTLWGGAESWGYRVSYGHGTGTDYEAGNGDPIPSSYKSRDLFVAIGWDAAPFKRFEFNYLRLDQTDVEFPGLVYDLNYLVTDGYELKYSNFDPSLGARIDSEVWYNQTRFEGDTLKSGKEMQIPMLSMTLFSPSGFDGFAITDASGQSMGYRSEVTFGHLGQRQTSWGVDLTHVKQQLNDIEPFLPDDDNNFPIPPSYSVDGGLYVEDVTPVNDIVTVRAGARVDFISVNADSQVDGVPDSVEELLFTDSLHREFYLWSAFLTAEAQLNDVWSVSVGGGHGQRPPTLTELYSISSFIGSLQRGLTALEGDPHLDPERMTQIDAGLNGDYGSVRVGAHGYYSWINDLITYDLLSPAGGAGGLGGFPQTAQFMNTDHAIIAGFETYGEADVSPWVTVFGTMSYIEGRDLSRDEESDFGSGFGRSDVSGRNHEPLPGIPPLETRLGLRFHDDAPVQKWGIELSARIVDDQDRVAASLEEIETPGFTTYDVRAFKRAGQWLFTAGIENFTDKYYREHLDYRSGFGVFRPGINFYSGVEVTY